MIRTLSIAALAVATTSLSGFAAADPAPATTAPATTVSPADVSSKPAKKAHDPNEVICRTIPEAGSRLGGTKSCMTRADWDQQAHDSRATMSDFQANHTSTGMGSK
jgi:hypothetical protein